MATNEQLPLWKLFLGFLAFIGVVGGAVTARSLWLRVLIVAAGFGLLGVSAWLWGYDSREKSDWPRRN